MLNHSSKLIRWNKWKVKVTNVREESFEVLIESNSELIKNFLVPRMVFVVYLDLDHSRIDHDGASETDFGFWVIESFAAILNFFE